MNELEESAKLATKYKIPSLVVHQSLVGEAQIMRLKTQGQYKIIAAIDWPKGDNFGSIKMRGVSVDTLEAEGFEILVTPNKNFNETKTELKYLHDFIRNHISKTAEVRFVIGTGINEAEHVEEIVQALKTIPTPALIRNDTATKQQVGKANIEIHKAFIDKVKSIVSVPIKISGNINDIKTIAQCQKAKRFGVSVLQAKQLVKELNNNKASLSELLS